MEQPIRILFLEDNPDDVFLSIDHLQHVGLEIDDCIVETEEQFKAAIIDFNPHIILSDINLPGFDGRNALKIKFEIKPETPLIYFTNVAQESIAIECLNEGADDFVYKEHLSRLGPTLIRVLKEKQQEKVIGKLESEKQQTEHLYKTAINAHHDAFIIVDENGLVTEWNNAASQIFGYSYEEVLGQDLHQLITPQRYQSIAYQGLERFKHSGLGDAINQTIELSGRRKDGSEFPVELSLNAMQFKGTWHSMGIVKNISERKAAEQSLKESEQRWQFALEGSRDGVWDWDIENNTVFFSERWTAMLGYQSDEIENQVGEWEDRIHPDDIVLWRQEINRHFSAETDYYESEHRLQKKDGSYLWVSSRGKVLQWLNSGQPKRMLGTNTDISSRKKTEEELRKNQELLKQAQKIAGLGSWELNVLTEQMTCSEETYRIYEIDPLVFDNKYASFVNIIHPDDVEQVVKTLMSATINRETYNIEHRLLMKDGRGKFVSQRGECITDEKGRVINLLGTVQDVTEIKYTENALRSSQAQFSSVINDLPALVCRNKPDGTILFVNNAYCQYFNKTYQELIGSSIFELIPDEEHIAIKENFACLNERNPIFVHEHKVIKPGGEIAYQRWTNRIISNENGEHSIQAYGEDITQQKQHEYYEDLQAKRTDALLKLPEIAERLDESEFMQLGQEMAEDLTESKIAFIHFVNLDQTSIELVTWSKRTLEDYCEAVFEAHYPVESAGIWADALRKRHGIIFNDYESYPHKKGLPEGHALLQRLISVPVIENNRVVMLAGVGNKKDDYTEHDVETVQLIANEIWRIVQRRRSDTQLNKLAQAVEQSPENIVITNLDGEIEYVNRAFVNSTGYSTDELIGKNPRILQSGDTPRDTYEKMWSQLTQGNSWRGELYNQTKDGELYIEFAHIAPIRKDDGVVSHYLAIKEDITEKKRIAEELDQYRFSLEKLVSERTAELEREREKAELASRAKSAFLANMSHEIRTPMNAILGLSHLISRSDLSAKQANRLTKIQESANHLLSIINDILDLSKIEAGKIELEHINFHIEAVFEHVLSLLKHHAEQKKIQLLVEKGDIPDWLNGDQMRIRQALLNYVGNAIKFTEQGIVTIRARLEERTGDDLKIRFEVEDTGIGIDKSKIDKLFKKFEQADVSTTRKYGGTGLGLTITRRLAELMGGEVGVSSEIGKGSIFWFTVKLTIGEEVKGLPQEKQVQMAEMELAVYHPNTKILLVEDNEINREVAVDILAKSQVKIDTAENGIEAVNLVRSRDYELILMDIQMPEMDGLEATRIIRQFKTKQELPILAMTANVFEEDKAACLDAGMVDFVAKPVDPENLFGKIIKWLPAKQGMILNVDETMESKDNLSHNEAKSGKLSGLSQIRGLDVQVGLKNLRGDLNIIAQKLLDLIAADDFEASTYFMENQHTLSKNFALSDIEELSRLLEDFNYQDAFALFNEMLEEDANAEEVGDNKDSKKIEEKVGPIDHSVLERMFGDKPEKHKSLMNKFLKQATTIADDLGQAYSKKDVEQIAFLGHKLKSSSRTVGANALADICYQLELNGKAKNWREIEKYYQDMSPELTRVSQSIEKM